MNVHSRATITDKQYKILVVICEGNKDLNGKFESPVDLDQLLERIAYDTTKESMQFSIRALMRRGLITKDKERRRGALRAVYYPTREAKVMMGYRDPHYLEAEEDDFSYLDV